MFWFPTKTGSCYHPGDGENNVTRWRPQNQEAKALWRNPTVGPPDERWDCTGWSCPVEAGAPQKTRLPPEVMSEHERAADGPQDLCTLALWSLAAKPRHTIWGVSLDKAALQRRTLPWYSVQLGVCLRRIWRQECRWPAYNPFPYPLFTF